MITRYAKRSLFVGLPLVLSVALFAAVSEKTPANWPMLGGTPGRNMVNTVDKNLPTEWDVKTKKNIKWVAALGSTTYGNPVIEIGRAHV